MCRIGDVYCLPAAVHQPFSFNVLDISAPEEACSKNVRASGTLKFGYQCIFKITAYVCRTTDLGLRTENTCKRLIILLYFFLIHGHSDIIINKSIRRVLE